MTLSPSLCQSLPIRSSGIFRSQQRTSSCRKWPRQPHPSASRPRLWPCGPYQRKHISSMQQTVSGSGVPDSHSSCATTSLALTSGIVHTATASRRTQKCASVERPARSLPHYSSTGRRLSRRRSKNIHRPHGLQPTGTSEQTVLQASLVLTVQHSCSAKHCKPLIILGDSSTKTATGTRTTAISRFTYQCLVRERSRCRGQTPANSSGCVLTAGTDARSCLSYHVGSNQALHTSAEPKPA